MVPSPAAIEQALEILTRTPQIIVSLSAAIPGSQLYFKSVNKSWSANDVLAHLRACADVWGDCIAAILEQDHPTLQDIHPRTWIKETGYIGLDFHKSLQAFNRQRDALLKRLATLKNEDWLRTATIVKPPTSRQQTVFHYVRRMAKHEKEHWFQFENLLSNPQH